MIPSLAVVHIHNPRGQWKGMRLWLPLILLYIPLLLLSPLILLVVIVACLLGQVSPLRAIATLWGILCSLSGTDVHVRAEGKQVMVRIV
jgi:hypothetical protein